MRAMMRSPERTWVALGHLREGRIEEGLRLLADLANVPVNWDEIDIDWLVLAGHCLTESENSPKGNVPRHESWQ